MGSKDRARGRLRVREDLRRFLTNENLHLRRLQDFSSKAEGISPVLADSLRFLEEALREFGSGKGAEKALRKRRGKSVAEREKAACTIALAMFGERYGLQFIADGARHHRDPGIHEACRRVMSGMAETARRRVAVQKAPGGFIHDPVGREKGYDHP